MIESARLVTVAMLTYRRLDQLPDVIPAVLAQLDELVAAGGLADRAELLVVDNDPAASARSVVETVGQGRPEVRYVCEPEPGIAAGRNRALDETETSDAVVFIDDDERPGTGWLVHLVRTWRDSGAGAVSGPVRSTFVQPVDPWVEASRFYARDHRAGLTTGTRIGRAATNNLLLEVGRRRASEVRFDEAFGLSGGSDSLFTEQLVRAGVPMVWCAEAVVTEAVPPDRAGRDYVVRRTYSLSNVSTRVDIALAAPGAARLAIRARSLSAAAVRSAVGAATLARGALGGSLAARAGGRVALARAAGAAAASVGRRYTEYARPSKPETAGV